MALNNPAFNNPAFQDPRAVKTYPGGPQAASLGGQTQFAAAQHAGTDAAAQAQLEGMYAAPPAGAIETDRMTVEDTVWKTVGLFAVLLVTAVGGWIWTMAPVTAQNPSPNITAVDRRRARRLRPLARRHLHVAQEDPPRADLRLRRIRGPLRRRHLGVLRVHLARHRPAGDARDARRRRRDAGALRERQGARVEAGHQDLHDRDDRLPGLLADQPRPDGLQRADRRRRLRPAQRAQLPVRHPVGRPHRRLRRHHGGVLAGARLRQIQQGVRNGAPRQFGWLGGFGIMVTVVWLYIEILRILAIARGNS